MGTAMVMDKATDMEPPNKQINLVTLAPPRVLFPGSHQQRHQVITPRVMAET